MRISIRGFRPVNSSFATRSEKLNSSRQTGRVLASTRWNRYHRTSGRATSPRERRSRRRLAHECAIRAFHAIASTWKTPAATLFVRAPVSRARPRRECVSGGSITASPVCACRVVDPPRAFLARHGLRPLPSRGRAYPRTPATNASRPLSRIVRDSASSLRRGQLSDPATEARNIVKAASRAHFSTVVPLDESDDLVNAFSPPPARPSARPLPRVRPPRADHDAPESTSTMTLDAGFGPRPDPSASEENGAEAYLASLRTTLDSTLEETPMPVVEGFSTFSIDHFDRVDRRRDRSTSNRSGWGPPAGWSSTRDASWTRKPPNREKISRRFNACANARSTDRPPEYAPRSSSTRDRSTNVDGERFGRRHARRNRTNRVSDTNRRREVARERVDGEAAPETRTRGGGVLPSVLSRRVVQWWKGYHRVVRAARRRVARESPTVRAVRTRGASSHDCGADEREDAIGARETRGTRSSGRGETRETWERRERRRRTSRARSEVRERARRATGTSRPTSHLPERFGAGFGGAARRWAR